MAWCLKAPSQYLHQCWWTISGILWYLPEGSSQEFPEVSLLDMDLKIQTNFKIYPHHQWVSELNIAPSNFDLSQAVAHLVPWAFLYHEVIHQVIMTKHNSYITTTS